MGSTEKYGVLYKINMLRAVTK